MSENSSFTGQGSETDAVSDEKNLAAEEAYLHIKRLKPPCGNLCQKGIGKDIGKRTSEEKDLVNRAITNEAEKVLKEVISIRN